MKLFRRKPEPITFASHAHLALRGVGASIGLQMMAANSANQVLRHCRIGKITKRP